MSDIITFFGWLLPFVPQSTVWTALAMGSGVIAFLWVYSIIRFDILMTFLISLFVALPFFIVVVIWRFLTWEPVLNEAVAFHWVAFGAVLGPMIYYLALLLNALEDLKKEKLEASK
jgi:hypothetical protein